MRTLSIISLLLVTQVAKSSLDLPVSADPAVPADEDISIVEFYDGLYHPTAVCFFLDSSGSMKGPTYRQQQTEARRALEGLANSAYFNVVLFNSSVSKAFPTLVPATRANRARATVFINRGVPDNDTCMAEALRITLELLIDSKRPRPELIMTSDGLPYRCRLQPETIHDVITQVAESNVGRTVRIHTVYVECLQPARVPRSFLKHIAANHGGTFRSATCP